MKAIEELSTEKYRKHTRNRCRYNRWVKRERSQQNRRLYEKLDSNENISQ